MSRPNLINETTITKGDHSPSISEDFIGFLNKSMKKPPTYYLSAFAQNTSNLNNLLNTSKGRDKFCQLVQYNANLYVTSMKHSEVYKDAVR